MLSGESGELGLGQTMQDLVGHGRHCLPYPGINGRSLMTFYQSSFIVKKLSLEAE